jgi:hypothetical protein
MHFLSSAVLGGNMVHGILKQNSCHIGAMSLARLHSDSDELHGVSEGRSAGYIGLGGLRAPRGSWRCDNSCVILPNCEVANR